MNERGTYGTYGSPVVPVVGFSTTDKKAVGGFAVVASIVLLIATWPKIGAKIDDRRHRRSAEKLLEQHREWKRRGGRSGTP